jgi:hypothetical protein
MGGVETWASLQKQNLSPPIIDQALSATLLCSAHNQPTCFLLFHSFISLPEPELERTCILAHILRLAKHSQTVSFKLYWIVLFILQIALFYFRMTLRSAKRARRFGVSPYAK